MTTLLIALLMQAASTMPTRTVVKGALSLVDRPRQAVARTADDWAKIWAGHDPDRQAPEIDFTKETVVAVFLGSRPTAGYAVDVVSVTRENGKLVVKYRETKPQPGLMLAQVITSPFDIVAIPKSDDEVTFQKVD
jgi:hypothetical protein